MHRLRPLAFLIGLALFSGCGDSASVAPNSHTAGQSVVPRITDSAGRLVRFMSDPLNAGFSAFVWDGLTDSGLPVGGGVYFFVLEIPTGERFVGRVVLIR